MVLVGGEAGVGKSRLVGEAGAQARRHGARVLVGQCLDLEEGGLPYAPLVDMLRTPRPGSVARGGRRHARLAACLPRTARRGRSGAAPVAAGPSGGVGLGSTGPAGQARLFELLLTVIERLVAAGPVVLVFEDLHWADRSTLDLVALIASNTRDAAACARSAPTAARTSRPGTRCGSSRPS